MGYSRPNREHVIESFANHWANMYTKTHEQKMTTIIMTFEHEYNDVWAKHFSALEEWLVKNDAQLAATKHDAHS